MEQKPDSQTAAANLRQNRLTLGPRLGLIESPYTPPDPRKYPHPYYWDSLTAARIGDHAAYDALMGEQPDGETYLLAAAADIREVAKGEKNGFIPNIQFRVKNLDWERKHVLKKGAEGTNYMQPPLFARALFETYLVMQAYGENGNQAMTEAAERLLLDMYPVAKRHYNFWDRTRRNGPDDPLIGTPHPHETGRDSDPTFDALKPYRLRRNGLNTPWWVDKANIGLDYAQILAHGRRLTEAGGDLQKMRELYWMNDVMMNCIYVDNLYCMADLATVAGKTDEAIDFSRRGREVEDQVLRSMWDEKDQRFYALDGQGQHIKETTISNLFPVLLPNVRPEQLKAMLDLMDSSFNTPYPLPSVTTDSDNYDPHNREWDRLWRGPKYIIVDEMIARGLHMQATRSVIAHHTQLRMRADGWAWRIKESSYNVVAVHGAREHYNPITSQGQRWRVRNFAWSNYGLCRDFVDYDMLYQNLARLETAVDWTAPY